MVKLYLVRHACTTWNEENRIQGSHNPDLSARGKDQAKRLARRFKKENISFIVSSDLLRTAKTARIVQKSLNVPIRYEKGLREIHLGSWEGKTPEEVDRLYQNGYQKWLKSPSGVRIPEAEPVPKFRKRVLGTFGAILHKNPEGNIVVVTHGGVISTLLSNLLSGREDYFLLRLRLDNAGLTVIQIEEKHHVVIHCVNDISHLR